MLQEILPGIHHWTVVWPEFRLESYWLRTGSESVVIDAHEGAALDDIWDSGDCSAVIITSRWHERSSLLFSKRTGATVFVPEGHERGLELVESYETYGDGDRLPGGLRAIRVFGEAALLSDLHGGTLIVGDGLGTTAKWTPKGEAIGFHPGSAREVFIEGAGRLLEHEFENLLPAHGPPLLGDAKAKLAEAVAAAASASA